MNKKQIKIAPSILSADFSKLGEEVQSIEQAGADYIHCDVMDGVFVNNITFGIKMIADMRKHTSLPLDCHLMIVNPERYVERFAEAGADIITIHFEACKEIESTLQKIKDMGKKCGLAVNPDTPAKAIEKYLPLCDMVTVMSVYPGFGGQSFMEEVLPKVKELSEGIKRTGKEIELEIDGGINTETAKLAVSAGVNVLVAGSFVFKAKDRAQAIASLR